MHRVHFLALVSSPGESQTCPGGIAGISSASNVACCPVGCITCGGRGCSKSGADSGLGAESCCASRIKASQDSCSETGRAPCVIGDTTGPSYSGGQYGDVYAGDGTYYGHTTEGNCAFFDNVPDMYEGMIAGDNV